MKEDIDGLQQTIAANMEGLVNAEARAARLDADLIASKADNQHLLLVQHRLKDKLEERRNEVDAAKALQREKEEAAEAHSQRATVLQRELEHAQHEVEALRAELTTTN
eukprot:scaffold175367_cov47-Prasinocladus_malaysianus.AAC.1